jgi:hypothetical protein
MQGLWISMTDATGEPGHDLFGALEQEKARLLEQATTKIEHEMAEMTRLALAYPAAFKAIAKRMGMAEAKDHAPTSPTGIETLGDLSGQYRTSPNSPIHNLKHNSREHYEALISLIEADCSAQKLADADAATLDAWYEKWREGGKVGISHSKMVMLRNLFGFGTMSARDENCARLFGLLGKMKIELPRARTEQLTRDQANLIRAKAHAKKRSSVALAQAFQFDVNLTQKDTIGEWTPVSEPGISDVIHNGMKWLRGLRWEEIDSNLMLRHASGEKEITPLDLKKCPMVMQELDIIKMNGGQLPTRGPVIRSEHDNLPWDAIEFRRWWRLLANECGIPKTVRNSDSRTKRSAAAPSAVAPQNMSGGIFE